MGGIRLKNKSWQKNNIPYKSVNLSQIIPPVRKVRFFRREGKRRR